MRRQKEEGRGQKGNPINKSRSVLNEVKDLGFQARTPFFLVLRISKKNLFIFFHK